MREIIFRAINNDGIFEYSDDLGLGEFFTCIDDGLLDNPQQYTGLDDENGIRIFEGDIITYNSSPKNYCLVFWNNKVSSFDVKSKLKCFNDTTLMCIIDHFGAKIVGNMHESPELLK
jgi:uncharacterized phage protein (TIGR01671 family)